MIKKDTESNQNLEKSEEPKEFTATDVKNIYNSVDEKNGFHIDFIINKFRTRMKQNSKS